MMKYNIGGALYPVVFNFNTMRKFMKQIGINEISKFDEVMSDKPEKEITISDLENRMELIHQAIIEGCRINKQECTLTVDDLFEEMSKNPEMVTDMITAFVDSQPQATEEEGKKKAVLKK